MGSKTVGLRQAPGGRRTTAESSPAPPGCAPEAVAAVLGALLPSGVSADQVVARAVALGLLRHPDPDRPPRLSAQVVARLLLAGYRLPAHVEAGTVAGLQAHVRAGRHVFVPLHGLDPNVQGPADGELVQVTDTAGDLGIRICRPGQASGPTRLLAPEAFGRAWAAAERLLIVALRGWDDLPAEGRSFFGGTRDADGTYHWDTAECATDAGGRVRRC